MTNTSLFHIPSVYNLSAYKAAVKSIPDLNATQERELAQKFKDYNDLNAAQNLVLSQLKTVIKIAHEFKNYGLDEQDLIQEGNIGLMRAVKHYDYSKNVRLYTFSVIWIKSEIQAYIIKNWKIVKIATTKNLKKLFFNFRSLYKQFEHQGIDKNLIPNHIIKSLKVDEKEVRDISSYFSSTDLVLDSPNSNDDDFHSNESQAINSSHLPPALVNYKTPEKLMIEYRDREKQLQFLEQAYTVLDEREKFIIKNRFLETPTKTHKEIGKQLNLSSERVRQLELSIIEKLKKQVSKR